MKTASKKIILAAVILIVFVGLFIPLVQVKVQAADNNNPLKFKPSVSIPGSDFLVGQEVNVQDASKPNLMVRYIQSIYKFFVGIAGVLAVFMIVFGGVTWLFSGGSSEKISRAKEVIVGSVAGLVLALGSYVILNTINPSLVNYQLTIQSVPGALVQATYCRDVQLPPEVPDQFNCVTNNGQSCSGSVSKSQTTCGAIYKIPNTESECYGAGGCQEDSGEACVVNYAGREAKCLKCQQLGNSEKLNPLSMVGFLQPDLDCEENFKYADSEQHCTYTHDLAINSYGTCAFYDLQCDQVKTCEDYNEVMVKGFNGAKFTLTDLAGPLVILSALTAIPDEVGNELKFVENIMTNVCSNDPCKVREKDSKNGCYTEEDHATFLDIGPPQLLCQSR